MIKWKSVLWPGNMAVVVVVVVRQEAEDDVVVADWTKIVKCNEPMSRSFGAASNVTLSIICGWCEGGRGGGRLRERVEWRDISSIRGDTHGVIGFFVNFNDHCTICSRSLCLCFSTERIRFDWNVGLWSSSPLCVFLFNLWTQHVIKSKRSKAT